MIQAYISCFKRAFDFKGRSSRKEYWGFFGCNCIVMFLIIILAFIGGELDNDILQIGMVVYVLYAFVSIVPSMAAAVRRVHDRNLHWYFLLIPYYNIILMFMAGDKEPNQFGPDPHAASQGVRAGAFPPNQAGIRSTDNGNQNHNMDAAGKKFCTYCGNIINPSAAFCTICGKQILSVPKPAPDAPRPVSDTAEEESGMNRQRVEQILKEIFSKYGTGIIREQQRFRSAVYDFLSEEEYRDEKIVFRNAVDSGALMPFAEPSSVTEDTVRVVLSELQQKGHLTEKDARFVVQCTLTACGCNINIR